MQLVLTEILKRVGLSGKEAKTRIKNGQIKINGESITDKDTLFNLSLDKNGSPFIEDAGNFLYRTLKIAEELGKKRKLELILFLFDNEFEFIPDSNLSEEDDIVNLLKKDTIFLRTGKKQLFRLKLKHDKE